jgi:hypothetical protein
MLGRFRSNLPQHLKKGYFNVLNNYTIEKNEKDYQHAFDIGMYYFQPRSRTGRAG